MFSRVVFALLLPLLVGCSSITPSDPARDPWERMNRGTFWFNEQADRYAIKPVATVYDEALPQEAKSGVGNFFSNLRYPIVLLSSLVQLKFGQVAEQTGRFVVNSTLGLLGLFDPATDMGLEENDDDFGVALGYHGVPEGPYLVLPILGPSNVRDGLGRLVDFAVDPLFFLEFVGSWGHKPLVFDSSLALKLVDTRAGMLENIETAKKSALDYYLFMQSAYHQYRQGLIYDGQAPDEEEPVEEDEAGK
ncbi:MAG: VacJ family lipoprotein [Oligoflexia bacterium]|nr:VacJ family lipoprotein [Oligoflexia bacterium]